MLKPLYLLSSVLLTKSAKIYGDRDWLSLEYNDTQLAKTQELSLQDTRPILNLFGSED